MPEDPDLTTSLLVFTKLAAIISSLLQIPKYVQLQPETLETQQLLSQTSRAQLVETFRTEVINILDGVSLQRESKLSSRRMPCLRSPRH